MTKRDEFIRFCLWQRGADSEEAMVRLDSLLRSALCASCFFCMALRMSKSEGDSNADAEIAGNGSSREQQRVLPTPLMLHLNRSTAQLLIQEANSVFVSNTSLSDLVNDNETQQMLLRYRERKRQVRILTIQREILQKLGLTRGPNVTARLSAEERQSLVRSFDRTMVEREDISSDNETACVTGDDTC